MTDYVYIATSLDGFIAERDGGTRVAHRVAGSGGRRLRVRRVHGGCRRGRDGPDHVRGGGQVRGLALREAGLRPEHDAGRVPADLADKVEIVSGDPRSVVAALHERGFDDLYVDGGRTIQGFLAADSSTN